MTPGFLDLFGTFDAKVDLQSGRVSLPTDFTSLKGQQVMVTVEPLKRYLEVRSLDEFNAFQQRIRRKADEMSPADATALRVNYLGTSTLAQVDNTFRLVLPKRSREVLLGRPDVVLVGVGDSVQVWLADRWAGQHETGDQALQGGYDGFAGEIHRMAPAPAPVSASGAVQGA